MVRIRFPPAESHVETVLERTFVTERTRMPRVLGLLSNRDSFQRIRDAAKAEWRGMTVGPRPLHLAVCAGISIPVQAGGIFAQDQPFVQFGPSPQPRDVAHSNRALSVPDRRDHVDAAELRNKCRRDRV